MRWFWRLLAGALGVLFVYTGAIKAWDPVGFAGDIENYHLVPWTLGVRLAFYLPWLEIFCGLGLLTRAYRIGALALLSGAMLVFIGAAISANARGLDITCGCFGHAAKPMTFATHLLVDGVILAALLALGIGDRRELAR